MAARRPDPLLPALNAPVTGKDLVAFLEWIRRSPAKQLFCWQSETVNATGTRYIKPWYSTADTATEKDAQIMLPCAGALQRMAVKHVTAGTSTNRLRYSVRLNGATTPLQIDVAGSTTVTVWSTTTLVKAAAGDLLSIQVERPDGSVATAPENVMVSWELHT